jgi:hypothetical protein
MNIKIFGGSPDFQAMQMANQLGYKTPPSIQAKITGNERGLVVRFNQELTLMTNEIVKMHKLSFQLPGG